MFIFDKAEWIFCHYCPADAAFFQREIHVTIKKRNQIPEFLLERCVMKERIICLVIGYLFGCVLTADIVVKKKTGKRADAIGTGNPGMANVMAQLGFKAGITVLIGDIVKTFAACGVGWYFFKDLGALAVLYSGFGVSLGHNFPFWRKFTGGKGVAVTCSFIVIASPLWGILSDLAGAAVVFATGYLCLGAVVIPAVYIAPAVMLFGPEAGWITAASTAMMLMRHGPGLIRMTKGEEKKIDLAGKIRTGLKKTD